MERLRQLLGSINAQLSGLSVSQRLAIALCAVVIAGSLLWLAQWSQAPEMVVVFNRDLGFDELSAAEDALRAEGIRFSTRGMRVFVPAADRHNALRLMHAADVLPQGGLFDMAAVVSDSNPFQSPEARSYAQNYARGNELAKIIATYPFVRQASVIINPVTKRRIGGGSMVPTASVVVTMGGGNEMTPEIVEGFAKLVSGAVGGLLPHNVTVTDSRSGRSYGVPHPDDPGGFDQLAIQKRHERHLHDKIIAKLSYIPGVMATVTVELDQRKRTTQTFLHDDPLPQQETSETQEQNSTSQPSEPGVQANLGTAVTAGGRGQSSSKEKTGVQNFPPQLKETETIEHMPFAVSRVTATVSIPRSFVTNVYKLRFPDKEEPKEDDADFVAIRNEQIGSVRAGVEKIVQARQPEDVNVDVYPDMEWNAEGGVWSQAPVGVAAGIAGVDAMSTLEMARTYGPPVGLGVLAVMSILMLSRIARKSVSLAERKKEEDGDPMEEGGVLTVGQYPVGEAEASASMLAAKEVDPATLKYQEIGDEVARMVEEDPQGGAQLIRRWVEEE